MRPSVDDLIIKDKYRVEQLLGKGAFAWVYQVRHLDLGVSRAVKVLSRDVPGVGSTTFDDYQSRFRLEAQLGAQLDHPHVAKVYDFEAQEDMLYLVMEYASGGSLAELLKKEGPLPLDDFLRIALDIAVGLGAIHEELEVVHRDVKPSNILLTKRDRAKIGDLGLAQMEGMSRRSRLGSEASRHPGTSIYMSPEQEREHGYLQYPSDVYSLGCVMFEMLTGKIYKKERTGTRVSSLRQGVPEWLDDLVANCLQKDRDKRPWDGNEVAELLREDKRERQRAQELAARQKAIEELMEKAHQLRLSGKYTEAIDVYSQAITLNPEQATAYYYRGNAYYNKGHYNRAIADYDRTIEIDPQRIIAYNHRGLAYRKKGDYDRAIADYDWAIKLDPQDAVAYNHRGRAYYEKGDYDRALADYDRAIELDPQDAVFYNNRGNVYYDKGNYDRAIADYDCAIALDAQYAIAHYNRGNVHYHKGNYNLAIIDYDRAIEINSQDATPYNNRGLAYYKKGDYNRAIVNYDSAIALNPEEDVVYYNRGLAYHDKGDYGRAIADYDRAIALNPNKADYYYSRGLSHKQVGHKHKAETSFEKAALMGHSKAKDEL